MFQDLWTLSVAHAAFMITEAAKVAGLAPATEAPAALSMK